MSRCRRVPSASVLLLLVLLSWSGGGLGSPVAPRTENHCRCIQKSSQIISSRRFSSVTFFPESPQCPVLEVIVTLKNGKEICLDPTATWVQKLMAKIQKYHHQNHQPTPTSHGGVWTAVEHAAVQ